MGVVAHHVKFSPEIAANREASQDSSHVKTMRQCAHYLPDHVENAPLLVPQITMGSTNSSRPAEAQDHFIRTPPANTIIYVQTAETFLKNIFQTP